jgi:hypothetical protein
MGKKFLTLMWQDNDQPQLGERRSYGFEKGIMMLPCLALVSPSLAGQGNSKIMAVVKTVMEQHNQSFNAQDLNGVMTLYASNPNTVLMGTGPGEAYVGDVV